jgi:hypothetical protein
MCCIYIHTYIHTYIHPKFQNHCFNAVFQAFENASKNVGKQPGKTQQATDKKAEMTVDIQNVIVQSTLALAEAGSCILSEFVSRNSHPTCILSLLYAYCLSVSGWVLVLLSHADVYLFKIKLRYLRLFISN